MKKDEKIKKSIDMPKELVSQIQDEANKERRVFQQMTVILLEEAMKERQGK